MHIWFVSKQLLLKIAVVTKPISKFAIVLKLCYFLISFITHVNLPKQLSYCFFLKEKPAFGPDYLTHTKSVFDNVVVGAF
jgi:hypothetical protein